MSEIKSALTRPPEYQFKALVKTNLGNKKITIDAPDALTARQRLRSEGVVLHLKKKGKARKLKGRMSYSKRQIFLSRLAAMLGSGIGASEALNLMKVTFSGVVSDVSGALLQRLENNSSLSDAMASLGPKIMPKTTVAMIEAGAYAGDTAVALRDAMLFERTMNEVKKDSSKGILQALVSFFIAILFIMGTIYGFMPYITGSQLMHIMEDTSLIDTTERISYIIGYFMSGLFVAFLGFFLLSTLGKKVAPVMTDRLILKIPFYRDMVLARHNFIAFYGLSLMVETGVSMEGALSLMEDTTPPGALKKDFGNAANAVRKGRPWANEIRTLEATDRAALGASLDRSQTAVAMKNISTQYRDIYGQRMETFVPVLQFVAVLALMVAGIIMFSLTMLPMMQMIDGIL